MFESEITVFFEDPYWVCVYQLREGEQLRVCRFVFGAQPGDAEVYARLLAGHHSLRFGPPGQAGGVKPPAKNPKRRRREAARAVARAGVGTKAQQAVQAAREENKTARKQAGKEQREAEKRRKYALRAEKRRQKHRGH